MFDFIIEEAYRMIESWLIYESILLSFSYIKTAHNGEPMITSSMILTFTMAVIFDIYYITRIRLIKNTSWT